MVPQLRRTQHRSLEFSMSYARNCRYLARAKRTSANLNGTNSGVTFDPQVLGERLRSATPSRVRFATSPSPVMVNQNTSSLVSLTVTDWSSIAPSSRERRSVYTTNRSLRGAWMKLNRRLVTISSVAWLY